MDDEAFFEIRVQDVLDPKWASYFSPMRITVRGNETVLSGKVHDQAELFGVLLKIRDAGLRLVSVNHQSPTQHLAAKSDVPAP